MDKTLLKLVVVFAVFNCTVIKALQLTPNGAVTLVCGVQQQFICTSSLGVTWSKGSTILKSCSSAGVCINPVVGHYTFSHNGSSFIMTFNPIKMVDNGETFSCGDTGGTESIPLTVKAELQSGKINDTKNGFLQVDTGCFDPTAKEIITVSWECENKNVPDNWMDLPPEETSVQSEVACSQSDCSLLSYKKHTKVAKFKQCDSCNLKVRAKLTYEPAVSSIKPVYAEWIAGVPIEEFIWEPYCWAVGADFIVVVLHVILIIPWLIFHYDLLLQIANYANYITLLWSPIMVGLIYSVTVYCSERPSWISPLAIVSLIVSVIIRILFVILLFADKIPVKQLKGYAITLKQLHCCGCQEPDKQNPGEHSHGQSTGHSDRGGDKRVGVSKHNDEHSKILMSTSGNANQQPRAQPPLPGISKSHQQLDEPHNKKTRGLSSNFEDPNSLPQFEARKHSLAPINATAEGDSDSTARKKKKKKKKKEGSDTARSDED